MASNRRRYEISDEEWELVKEFLPPEHTGKPGRPAGDKRTALNGMLWITRSGAPWRDLLERYGSWSTLYDKFKRWSDAEVFEHIFEVLGMEADMQDLPKAVFTIAKKQCHYYETFYWMAVPCWATKISALKKSAILLNRREALIASHLNQT